MVKRGKGFDTTGNQAVDQALVEGETGFVPHPGAGFNPWPGNGKAIGIDAERLDQVKVLFETAIVIAGRFAIVAMQDLTRGRTEPIPNAFTATIGRARAFYLE